MTPNPYIELVPESDGLHIASDDPWWREGWYFEFYDTDARLQFQAYQGVFPNAAIGDLNAAIFHQGRCVHQITKMDFHVPAEPAEQRLYFGPMKLSELEALKSWRVQYDTQEIQADLNFVAVQPPFSWAAARLWLETSDDPKMGSHHFDQLGRYTGKVWIEDKELEIDALGFRDRMWGWGGRKHWRSYLIMWAAFGEDCIANVAIQRFDDGRQSLCGYLHDAGKMHLLQKAKVEVEWDPRRWKTIAKVHVEVEDVDGRRFDFSGCPQGIADTAHRWKHRSDHMLFSVGEYRSGDRIGHGVMNWAFTEETDKIHEIEAQLDP